MFFSLTYLCSCKAFFLLIYLIQFVVARALALGENKAKRMSHLKKFSVFKYEKGYVVLGMFKNSASGERFGSIITWSS